MESAETADLLERAATGDIEAIQELSKLAAEDLILHMGLDEEEANNLHQDVLDLLSTIPDLSVDLYTDLNDESK
jgi:hypothetical protein